MRLRSVSPNILKLKTYIQNSRFVSETFSTFFLCTGLHMADELSLQKETESSRYSFDVIMKNSNFSVGCICSDSTPLQSTVCQLKTGVHPGITWRPASNYRALQTPDRAPAWHQRTTTNLLQPKRALGWFLSGDPDNQG